MIKLMLGDCLKRMKEIPGGSVDLVLTDPPYGITRNRWDSVIDFPAMWEQLARVSKNTTPIVFTASQPFSSALVMSNPKMFRHEWIWVKNRGSNFANTVREPMKEHEHVLVFCKKKSGWTYNKQMQERAPSGVSRVKYDFSCITTSENYGKFSQAPKRGSSLRVPSSVQKFTCETGYHPTQKPIGLLEYLIKTYTDKGQTVLDFTMGSGSTGVACVKTERNFVGIELDDGYFNIAKLRIEEAQREYVATLF